MQHFLGSAGRSAHPTLETWCPTTKEQGLAGSGAPRPTCRRPIRPQRRGAPRRRNKGLRGVKHHAQLAGGPSDPKDVVPRNEGTRVSGERSTTSAQPEAPPLSRRLHHSGGAPHAPPAGDRKVRTSGAGMVSNPSAAGGPSRPAPTPGPARPKPHPNRRPPRRAVSPPTPRAPARLQQQSR